MRNPDEEAGETAEEADITRRGWEESKVSAACSLVHREEAEWQAEGRQRGW